MCDKKSDIMDNMAATKLLYLQDFDVVSCRATVVAVAQLAGGSGDDNRLVVMLDATCFYPRGGGQDWDTGVISDEHGASFVVEETRLDDNSVVHHVGHFLGAAFAVGATVQCLVDKDRRSINTRLHSAGHLVDFAVDAANVQLLPVRGAHYPHMSFVEYGGELESEACADLQQRLQTTINDVIHAGSENTIRFMPVTEMSTFCRHVPENIPKNKPARVVIYNGNFGVPCGGTHVKNSSDIGVVSITKIKSKKGLTKISYSVAGIN